MQTQDLKSDFDYIKNSVGVSLPNLLDGVVPYYVMRDNTKIK